MISQYCMFFSFQWKKTQGERAKIIKAGLKNPTPNVSKAIMETEGDGKGRCSILSHFINNY